MEETKGFYDFCIPYNKDDKVLRDICKELVEGKLKILEI